ncbi:MAG: tyrosine decarboxylase [Candidatus Sericytochromatia bacterium]|nr:MAG: tyrosine decarboxylase [Candidatus Sericytochromatia bacterium]
MKNKEAFFLGPKSENSNYLKELVNEVLLDQFYWRKNYNAEDEPYILEKQRNDINSDYANLKQELHKILSELKKGVPFFSPRYIGHMVSETTIPAIIGYFAAMLYNPNNISSEASPVTTRYELIVAKMLSYMVGYDINSSWGHITSGGTIANLEAMWVARNCFFKPISIYKAIKELIEYENFNFLKDFKINDTNFISIGSWELLNLDTKTKLSLEDKIINLALDNEVKKNNVSFLPSSIKKEIVDIIKKTINKYSLQSLGIRKFYKEMSDMFNNINEPVFIIPQTKHYSYTKIFDILGLGSSKDNIIEIPCDKEFRIDIKKLEKTILKLKNKYIPIVALISVFGSTEEGSIDAHKEIVNLKNKFEKDFKVSFYLHSDAAWGGYIASIIYDDIIMFKKDDISFYKEIEDFSDFCKKISLNKSKSKIEHLYNSIKALKDYDSITIDPHKLGYIPYPAGSILFKSNKVKELLSVNAPYVFHENSNFEFIGKYIIEGSKPGAAACSCYLSHKLIPLNIKGHGKIILDTLNVASYLYNSFLDYNNNDNPFKIIPICEPDSNLLCFIVNSKNNKDIEFMNKLNSRIYEKFKFNVNQYHNLNYIISKTEFNYETYQGQAIENLLRNSGISIDNFYKNKEKKIVVLRVTCMNPWINVNNRMNEIDNFVETLIKFIMKNYINLLIYDFKKDNNFEKIIKKVSNNLSITIDYKLINNFVDYKEKTKIDSVILLNSDKINIFQILEKIKINYKVPITIISDSNIEIHELEKYGFQNEYDSIFYSQNLEIAINKIFERKYFHFT